MLDDDAAFSKQRRNLMVLSLFLFAMDFSGAVIPHEFSGGGIRLEFSNPERIISLMWIMLGYFAIRYYQYLDKERLGAYEYNEPFEYAVALMAFEDAKNNLNMLHDKELEDYLGKAYYVADFTRNSKRVSRLSHSEVPMKLLLLNEKNPSARIEHEVRYRLSRKHYFILEIREWMAIVVKTPYLTEFFLPLILPIMAAIYHINLVCE